MISKRLMEDRLRWWIWDLNAINYVIAWLKYDLSCCSFLQYYDTPGFKDNTVTLHIDWKQASKTKAVIFLCDGSKIPLWIFNYLITDLVPTTQSKLVHWSLSIYLLQNWKHLTHNEDHLHYILVWIYLNLQNCHTNGMRQWCLFLLQSKAKVLGDCRIVNIFFPHSLTSKELILFK